MMYDRYQGLIFDMDGTILDTEPTHHKAWDQVLAKYEMKYDAAVMTALNGSPTWRIAQFIIERHQVNIDPYQLADEKTAVAEAMLMDTVKPLPLIDVVKHYHRRRPMAVGTGSTHRMADKLLKHLGLYDYFDVIVGADDVVNHKPFPDTFLRCAELIAIAPEHCVVFEDADYGIEAAKRAKMAVVDVRKL